VKKTLVYYDALVINYSCKKFTVSALGGEKTVNPLNPRELLKIIFLLKPNSGKNWKFFFFFEIIFIKIFPPFSPAKHHLHLRFGSAFLKSPEPFISSEKWGTPHKISSLCLCVFRHKGQLKEAM
jgi:hypothetical protein